MELTKLSALELSKKIKAKEITVVDAVKAQLKRIEELEPKFHCYITVLKEEALKQAQLVQQRIDRGELSDSLFVGVVVAVKDNICTKGVETTCASKILTGFVPPYDAEVIIKLKEAGAIIIGKVNMDEFAMGSTTETSYYEVTKNPWDETCVPGGSSGGAAAAVAAEEAFAALGSDTGGSIRQPASFCGVTGIKPTYGTVSRYGLIAYGSSLDQIGPIARNVSDCTALLQIISGYDNKDSTSMKQKSYDYMSSLKDDVKGFKIGIPKGYFKEGLDESVKTAVLEAANRLKEKGAIVEEFELEGIDYAIPAYYVIASAEASSNLSRYDGVKYGYRTETFEGLQDVYKKTRSEGFGTEVKRRMMIGAFVLSSGYYDAYYNKALQVKAFIKKSFDKAFQNYDLILGPTAPTTALKIGENLSDPLKMYLGDIYTVAVNLAGLPAMSLPCGSDLNGLPIGVQLIANAFEETKMIQAAYSLEQTMEYKRPIVLEEEGAV